MDVEIANDRIHGHRELGYNIYNGRKGMDINNTYEGCASGVLSTEWSVFLEFVPPPKRSTADEF